MSSLFLKKKFSKEETLSNFSSYVLLQGSLMKKGQEINKWSKRFFVMLEDMILYYKDENDLYHPSGIIYLVKGKIKRDLLDVKKEFCFQIITNKRKEILLQAANEQEKEKWCDLLENTIQRVSKDYETEITDITKDFEKSKLTNLGLSKQIELISKPVQSLKGF
jgi:hypothetical protein